MNYLSKVDLKLCRALTLRKGTEIRFPGSFTNKNIPAVVKYAISLANFKNLILKIL